MRRLLIRPGAIGDCILSLPILQAARTDYTEVWAPRPVLPLIRFADRTRAIADTGLDLLGVVEGAQVPALLEFDEVYSWYGTNRPEFRDAVRHLPFKFFPAFPVNPAAPPRIDVPLLPKKNLAIIHPFSGSVKKNWPLESYRELAARMPLPVEWCAEQPFQNSVPIENLYELACWISAPRIFIATHSGLE